MFFVSLSRLDSETKQKTTNQKNALHDHTLKMNGEALENTLAELVTATCSSSSLGMLPDIAVSGEAGLAIFKLSSCSTVQVSNDMVLAICSYIV